MSTRGDIVPSEGIMPTSTNTQQQIASPKRGINIL